MAYAKYLEAKNLFPDKAYPNDRVAELQDLVKALEMTEKQKAGLDLKYQEAITKANDLFDAKNIRMHSLIIRKLCSIVRGMFMPMEE